MKTWKQKALIDGIEYTVVEHTDKECEKSRKDGQFLAPISHGFVCLYLNGEYKKWCGVDYAGKRKMKFKVELRDEFPDDPNSLGSQYFAIAEKDGKIIAKSFLKSKVIKIAQELGYDYSVI